MQGMLTTLRNINFKMNAPDSAGCAPTAYVTRIQCSRRRFIPGCSWDTTALPITYAGCLAEVLSGLHASLRELDLTEYRLGNASAQVVMPALGRLTVLRVLRLGTNQLGIDGARTFEPTLSKLTRLEQVDLSNNGLGAQGACKLLPALCHLPLLACLDLSGNLIGADALAPVRPR